MKIFSIHTQNKKKKIKKKENSRKIVGKVENRRGKKKTHCERAVDEMYQITIFNY